jgi:YVTN family beta-propeller protein
MSYPSVVGTIPVTANSRAISSDGRHVWVANYNAKTITKINCSTMTVVGVPISVTYSPRGISSDGTYVWVANYTNHNVTQINCSDNAVVRYIPVGRFPLGISSDGTNVWVANSSGNSVTQISCSTGTVVRPSITVGTSPGAISSDGTYVWVANIDSNNVTQISCSTGTVVRPSISVGTNPQGVSSDGINVWVANLFTENVTQISCSTGTVVQTIDVGSSILGISSDGTNVWVASNGSDSVIQISCSTGAVEGTISVGTNPIYISSDGTNVWVVNYIANSVSIIQIAESPPYNKGNISSLASANAGLSIVAYLDTTTDIYVITNDTFTKTTVVIPPTNIKINSIISSEKFGFVFYDTGVSIIDLELPSTVMTYEYYSGLADYYQFYTSSIVKSTDETSTFLFTGCVKNSQTVLITKPITVSSIDTLAFANGDYNDTNFTFGVSQPYTIKSIFLVPQDNVSGVNTTVYMYITIFKKNVYNSYVYFGENINTPSSSWTLVS